MKSSACSTTENVPSLSRNTKIVHFSGEVLINIYTPDRDDDLKRRELVFKIEIVYKHFHEQGFYIADHLNGSKELPYYPGRPLRSYSPEKIIIHQTVDLLSNAIFRELLTLEDTPELFSKHLAIFNRLYQISYIENFRVFNDELKVLIPHHAIILNTSLESISHDNLIILAFNAVDHLNDLDSIIQSETAPLDFNQLFLQKLRSQFKHILIIAKQEQLSIEETKLIIKHILNQKRLFISQFDELSWDFILVLKQYNFFVANLKTNAPTLLTTLSRTELFQLFKNNSEATHCELLCISYRSPTAQPVVSAAAVTINNTSVAGAHNFS